jgi:hypothetical protein
MMVVWRAIDVYPDDPQWCPWPLPSLDEWQVIMSYKALTFPDVMTVQYGRVLIACQSASRFSIGVRIIASNQRTRQNSDEEKRKQLFHTPP